MSQNVSSSKREIVNFALLMLGSKDNQEENSITLIVSFLILNSIPLLSVIM